ncbi:hypothetical protein ACJX0J_027981, partial [Zea mays]
SLSDSSSPLGSPVGTQGLRSATRTSTAALPISSTASGARRCPGDRPSRKSNVQKRKVSRLFQSTSMHPKPVPQKEPLSAALSALTLVVQFNGQELLQIKIQIGDAGFCILHGENKFMSNKIFIKNIFLIYIAVQQIAEDIDAKEVAFVQNGIYLKVQVTLVGFQTKQYGFARAIRPVTNFNEVALHFIECIYLHLENVRQKMQGQFPRSIQANVSTYEMQAQVAHSIQTKSPAYMPFSGGAREHQVDFAPEVNHGRFLSSVQTNTPTHVPFSGGAREQQVHFTPQPNQFSAYPGTGGHQHDLQSMVLEVMQRPDILALENGVHVDEVARRLGMPSAQIL